MPYLILSKASFFALALLVFCGHGRATFGNEQNGVGLNVVVSVKPLHSLIASLMQGTGQPRLLISGAMSPHAFSLRPSEAKALHQADVVFWIGPALEGTLTKVLQGLPEKTQVISFSEEKSHIHNEQDPHIWLDPEKAQAMVERIETVLAKSDPLNAATYRKNAQSLTKRLATLQKRMEKALAPLSKTPFAVFHDAYSHLIRAFRLNKAAFVAKNPHMPPGAKHIARLRAAIREGLVKCLFREPWSKPGLLSLMKESGNLQIGLLDPIGTRLEPGPDLYFDLMKANQDALVGCLGSRK
jgi:zinc transport system substrate-binding protein